MRKTLSLNVQPLPVRVEQKNSFNTALKEGRKEMQKRTEHCAPQFPNLHRPPKESGYDCKEILVCGKMRLEFSGLLVLACDVV